MYPLFPLLVRSPHFILLIFFDVMIRYTTVLRTLMVPILENREISEKILSNDATLIKEAFAFSYADHQTCVVEAQKTFDRMV